MLVGYERPCALRRDPQWGRSVRKTEPKTLRGARILLNNPKQMPSPKGWRWMASSRQCSICNQTGAESECKAKRHTAKGFVELFNH